MRICRSHICHHRMLIIVNPFTSRKAGVNMPRNISIHKCLNPTMCLTWLSSHCVSYVFWQYRAVSCPPVCVAPAANPLPASAKMRTLLKQSSQLTFLALGAPSPKEQDLLSLSSKPDPSSSLWWQRSCVGPRPAMRPLSMSGEKGDVRQLVFLPAAEQRSVCLSVFTRAFVYVFICVPCASKREGKYSYA